MRNQDEFDRICEDREKIIAAENAAHQAEGRALVLANFDWMGLELFCTGSIVYPRAGVHPQDELLKIRNSCYKKLKLRQDQTYYGA